MSVTINANPTDADGYLWLRNGEPIDEATSSSYTATAAGEYSVQVTVGECTEASNVIIVVVNPLGVITPTISTTSPLDWCEGTDISVLFTVDIADADSYQWLRNGDEIPDANNETHLANQAGIYSVFVVKDQAEGTSNQEVISVIPLPTPTITTDDPTQYCAGDNISTEISIDITGDAYQWLSNGEPIADATSSTYTATAAGEYSVEITTDGCTGISNGINIEVIENPVPTISTNDQLSWCEDIDISVNLSVDITDTDAGYQWYRNDTPIDNATESTYTASTIGFYSVEVTVNGCTGSSNTIEVIQDDEIYPIISTTNPTHICMGDEILVNLSVDITNADGYQWYLNGEPIIDAEDITHAATQAGVYRVEVNQGICSGLSNAIEVEMLPLPSPTISTTDQISWCEDQEISVLFEVDMDDANAYQWLLNGNPIENQTSTTYTATSVGEYSIRVTSADGCIGHSNTIVVIQDDELYPIISSGNPTQICDGDEVLVSFIVNIPNADSYQWYLDGDTITEAVNISYSATQAGVYRVGVEQGSCSGLSNEIEVEMLPVPSPTIATADALGYCEGDAISTEFTVDILEAEAYQWLLNDNPINNAITDGYSATNPGTYSVEVTVNGCLGTSNTQSIVVNPLPEVIAPNNFTVCNGDEATLQATGTADTYSWDKGVINGAVFSPAATQTYTVTGLNTSTGCMATGSTTITVHPLPEVLLPPSVTITDHESYRFDAGPNLNYLWFDNTAQRTYTAEGNILGVGSHTVWVIVTNGYGCSASDTTRIVVEKGTSVQTINQWGVEIFPNPTFGDLMLKVDNIASSSISISFRNLSGQEIYQRTLPVEGNRIETNVSLLGNAQGVYILTITDGKHSTIRRIVLQ